MATNILICGDCCPQDRIINLLDNGQGGEIFKDVSSFIMKADISIVNLEFPVVDNPTMQCISKAGPCLKGGANMITVLKSIGFDVVTLANNHIYDFGEEAVCSTLNALKCNGLLYFGGGRNLEEASRPLIIENEGQIFGFINICESEFSIATANRGGANPIDLITLYNQFQSLKDKVDYLIVIVHGGHEHYSLPSPRMKKLYRHFIDLGANVVVNHHQHCYSGYEKYGKGFIFYGLGNFCFDKKNARDCMWNKGFMLDLIFKDHDLEFKLHPYIQCSDSPDVQFVSELDEMHFIKDIERLNYVIGDDALLNESFKQWMRMNLSRYKSYLSPYSNRYLRYLCRLGLLPNNLTKDRKNVLYDMIKCESHNDIIIKILGNEY